ncbi:site-specific integrase [Mesorhizobium sp. CAU 1732]|uniref:tyrosine-type recombinase/integrase n=1 Tax=Mesorhizobium sp. CAU 1732 TaxID=3140358 RepID=UPI00325FE455
MLKLIQRRDGGFWWIRGTACGTAIYRSTKLTDRRLADRYRVRIVKDIEEAHARGSPTPKTFNEACKAYIEGGGSDRFLSPLKRRLGKKLLRDIAQLDLDATAKTQHPTAQPQTLNRQVYTPFIAVWNFAAENDWARVRKWRRPQRRRGTVSRPSLRRAGTFPVDYEHAARFVATMSPGPAMLMTALFYTGMRPIELFALTASEVNLPGRWITLTNTKTGEPRGVPIHEFLLPLFDALLPRGGAVFRTPRGLPYTPVDAGGGGLKSAILGARRRSGIKDVAPYTGRHTCSTGLVLAGVHPHIKDQILGHAVSDMSRHYTHVPQAPLIEAIDKLPVSDLWASLPWWEDPLAWSGRLAEGTGRRTDLERIKDV